MKYNGLTELGRKYLAKIQANREPVKFVKIKFGNGTLQEHENPADFTDVKNIKVEKSILELKQSDDAVKLTTQIDNVGLDEGYYPRETGIYVLDDDREILYYYINDGTEVSYLPPEASGPVRFDISINLIATSDTAITVRNDGKDLYITKEYLEKELAKKENTIEKKSGFNLEKTDSYEEDDTNKVATGRALKSLYDWIRNKLATFTLSWDRITNKPNLTTTENLTQLLKGKENTFAKNSGFNKEKTSEYKTEKSSEKLFTQEGAYNLNKEKASLTGATFTGRVTMNFSQPYLEFYDTRSGGSSGYVGFGTNEKILQLINRYSDGQLQLKGGNRVDVFSDIKIRKDGDKVIDFSNEDATQSIGGIHANNTKLHLRLGNKYFGISSDAIRTPTRYTTGETDADTIIPTSHEELLILRVESSSHATTNFPVKEAGLLICYCAYNSHIYQKYMTADTGVTYTRVRYANSWRPWKRLVTEDESEKYSAFYLTSDESGLYSSGDTPIRFFDGTLNNDLGFVYSSADKSLKCTRRGLYKIHLKVYVNTNMQGNTQSDSCCVCKLKQNSKTLSYFEATDHRNCFGCTLITRMSANDKLTFTSYKSSYTTVNDITFCGNQDGSLNNIYIERLGD